MPRRDATAPPDAIRIEDEVWQEAFARREPGRTRARRRLQAVDGDRTSSTLEPHAVVADRTADPTELPDWLAAVELDSAPAPSDSSLGETTGAGWLGDPSSAGSLTDISRAGSLGDTSRAGSLGDTSGAASDTDTTAGGPLAAPAQSAAASSTGAPARRTVTIRGRGAESYLPWPNASRGRPQRRAYERTGFRPDRLAMWAVLLGLLLVLVAILSAH